MDITFKPKELKPTRDRKNMNAIFLDKEFERKVLLHIVTNSLQKNMSPCFLAIEGKMGEGKTVQTINTCFRHGIHPYYFSSSQLAGNLEGDSIKELEATYNYLLEHDKEDSFSVIIIDDFHLSIASCDESISRTVNSQILTDYLMSIADTTKATPGKKIPFILIANTFEQLYLPLTRDGRMKLFKWEPSKEQKKNLIYKMYSDILVEGVFAEFQEFVEENINESLSFFGEVKNDIYTDMIENYLKEENFANLYEITKKFNNDLHLYDNKFVEVGTIKKLAEICKLEYRVQSVRERSKC